MKNKKVIIPLVNGFEETEYIAVRDILIREGFDVESISLTGDKILTANHNTRIGADNLFDNIKNTIYEYDILFIPGGSIGVKNLENSFEFRIILNAMAADNKIISAICAAPILLAKAGLLKDKQAVVFPDKKLIKVLKDNGAIYNEELKFVGDKNFFTGKDFEISIEFGYALSNFIKKFKD